MTVDDLTNDYLFDLTPERNAILTEMEAIAREKGFPIIGPLVGRIIYQLTAVKGAKSVFEMGSGFGYSTIWFAMALPTDGTVFFTDNSDENYEMALSFFSRSGVKKKVSMQLGDAIEILDGRDESFDIIFNDIDKANYPDSLQIAMEKLKPGGLLITDNILWKGKVVSGEMDPSTVGIREYTRALYDHPELFTTIIPVRDGISISLKIPLTSFRTPSTF
jgi:predicted O-methyltransferase YrrM